MHLPCQWNHICITQLSRMLLITFLKLESNFKLKLILTSHSLPWSYPDKNLSRSKGLERESMDNQHIKQTVEGASYILRYIASNSIAVLLGQKAFVLRPCFVPNILGNQ